jgi:hypothetical protein
MRSVTRRAAATAVLAVTALAASAGPAAAGPRETPNGWCGGANMRNAGDAMTTAMRDHTNHHGDAGMFKAVDNSACRP